MPSMTLRRWKRVRSAQLGPPHHRVSWVRGPELLEARSLLSISPTTIDAEADVSVTGQTTNEILDPAPFVWTYVSSPEPHYVGALEYGEATFNINGETLTTRAYRQQGGDYSIPGPTLNMVPGNKYVLRFRNLLPYEEPSTVHNDFKDPNITNVHTHGLHISGESPGDDVTRMFEGGFAGDYVYDIPADHMGGTFWYHAHHHGSTFLQVSTGGFGFIIIDDGQDQIPTNVAAMEERHVLIGYLDSDAAGTGGDTLVAGTFQPGWTVNGKVNGDLVTPPDTWQHWRVLRSRRRCPDQRCDGRRELRNEAVGPGRRLAHQRPQRSAHANAEPDRSFTRGFGGSLQRQFGHSGGERYGGKYSGGRRCRPGASSLRTRRSLDVVGLAPGLPP